MKTYLITSENVQTILRYLSTKPYAEVHGLIDTLVKLEENTNGTRPESHKKKV